MGGSRETELKLLAVRPTSPSEPLVVTTVTPVVKDPRALRNAMGSTWLGLSIECSCYCAVLTGCQGQPNPPSMLPGTAATGPQNPARRHCRQRRQTAIID